MILHGQAAMNVGSDICGVLLDGFFFSHTGRPEACCSMYGLSLSKGKNRIYGPKLYSLTNIPGESYSRCIYTHPHPAKWCFMKLSLISRTFQPAASAHPGSTPQPPNPFTTIASSSSSIMNAAHLACKLCIRKLALHSSILGSDPIHAYSWNSKPYPGTCSGGLSNSSSRRSKVARGRPEQCQAAIPTQTQSQTCYQHISH